MSFYFIKQVLANYYVCVTQWRKIGMVHTTQFTSLLHSLLSNRVSENENDIIYTSMVFQCSGVVYSGIDYFNGTFIYLFQQYFLFLLIYVKRHDVDFVIYINPHPRVMIYFCYIISMYTYKSILTVCRVFKKIAWYYWLISNTNTFLHYYLSICM